MNNEPKAINYQHEINACISEFDVSWNILADFKKGKMGNGISGFASFQSRLAYTLSKLCRLRGPLIRRKNREKRIQKSKLNDEESSQIISGIDEAIKLGESLGDAFAFFFYQTERDMLSQHLKHERPRVRADTRGHLLEYEFVSRLPMFGETFVLHHCVTSLLRHGDFSMISLPDLRVVALAELKAGEKITDGIQCQIHIVSERIHAKKFSSFRTSNDKNFNIDSNKNTEAHERLQKQMDAMSKLITPEKSVNKGLLVDLQGKFYTAELANVLKHAQSSGASFIKCGRGMILCAIKLNGKSFLERLEEVSPEKLKGILPSTGYLEEVASIVQKSAKNNAILVTALSGSVADRSMVGAGFVPAFWWDVPLDALKALYFNQIICVTTFNPSHFLDTLSKQGLTLVEHTSFLNGTLEGTKGNNTYRIEGYSFFCDAISSHLFTEESMLEMVRAMRVQAEELVREKKCAVRLNINFNQIPVGGIRTSSDR